MSKKLDEKIAKHMSEKKDQDDASLREKDDEKEPLAQKFEEGLAQSQEKNTPLDEEEQEEEKVGLLAEEDNVEPEVNNSDLENRDLAD